MKQLRYLLVLSLVGGTLSLSQSQDAPLPLGPRKR